VGPRMTEVEYVYQGLPSEIVCGQAVIDQLGQHLKVWGSERAMVVCGPNTLRSSNLVERVEHAVGSRLVARFSGVAQHAPVAVLRQALVVAQGVRPDTIISVGGGSALALSNGLALLLSTDRDLKDFAPRFDRSGQELPPLAALPPMVARVVAVPTTMGGAEFSPALGGFTDEAHTGKIIVWGNGKTYPSVIVVDGQALRATPQAVQVGAAMGQLRVAIEAFASTAHNPVGDAFALHAMRSLWQILQGGWPADVAGLLLVKTACMLGSMADAALGSGSGKLGVNSAMARQLGAICNIAHGDANAILLPHTVLFNAPGVGHRFLLAAEAFGVDCAGTRDIALIGHDVALRLLGLSKTLGVPTRLRDVGVGPESFDLLASATMRDNSIKTNAVPITDKTQVHRLFEQAW
jgi:alcohol dehydrogenase class IV